MLATEKVRIKKIIFIIILIASPIFAKFIIDNLKVPLVSNSESEKIKDYMAQFVTNHQNNQTGLFIEPTFESSFYGLTDHLFDLKQFTTINNFLVQEEGDLPYLDDLSFLVNYLWGKQNMFVDGGFSDYGGASTIQSTYYALESISTVDPNFFSSANLEKTDENNLFGIAQLRKWKYDMARNFLANVITFDSRGIKSAAIPEYTQTVTLPSPQQNKNLYADWPFLFGDDLTFQFFPTLPIDAFDVTTEVPADMQSTYYGLKMILDYYPDISFDHENMSKWIDSCFRLVGYSKSEISLLPDPVSTYYAIQAKTMLGYEYNITEKSKFQIFFNLLHRSKDGGYAATLNQVDRADIISTYYVLASMNLLNLTISDTQKQNIYDFIEICQNPDGGFGLYNNSVINEILNITQDVFLFHEIENITIDYGEIPEQYQNKSDLIEEFRFHQKSSFNNGWAAMKLINFLKNETLFNSSDLINPYKAWKENFRSKTYLYGYYTMEAQYNGLETINQANSEFLLDKKIIQPEKVLNFIDLCYNNKDGGYKSIPESINSSIYTTFCAVENYNILKRVTNKNIPSLNKTTQFFIDRQNNDTDNGFQIDLLSINQFKYILPPQYFSILTAVINMSISTTESTFWAIKALKSMGTLHSCNFTGAKNFILANQGPDGGFSAIRSYRTEIVSTYYALLTLEQLGVEPLSVPSIIKFVKNAQSESGAFTLNPTFEDYFQHTFFFIPNYIGWKILDMLKEKPLYQLNGIIFIGACIDPGTFGVGDYFGFGGSLHNMPMGIQMVDFITNYDLINAAPYDNFMQVLLVLILIFVIFWIIWAIIDHIKNSTLALFFKNKKQVDYLTSFLAIDVTNASIKAGKKVIISNISMNLKHGEILGVLGESGAGKSTFIKGLLGLRKYNGKVLIYGYDPEKEGSKLKPYYGYVPQDLSKIYEDFSVIDNLIIFGKQYGLEVDEITNRAKKILKSLQIADKEYEIVRNLSGGQKRRVSIAIALIHEPILCILDEPTSGLDPVVRDDLWLTLVNVNTTLNTTMIVITHYPEEAMYCDKVVILGRNRGIIDYGKPKELLSLLPGGGRVIELKLSEKIQDGLNKLSEINEIQMILERKLGFEYLLFSEESIYVLQNKILEQYPTVKIKDIGSTDATMEEFFRYRFLEVES